MGIELTWVPENYPVPPAEAKNSWGESLAVGPGYYDHIDFYGYSKRMSALMGEYGTYIRPFHPYRDEEQVNSNDVISVDTDPGCVETPTRILVDWDDAREVYERTAHAAKKVGLVPYEEHQETGMGHIHTTITPKEAHAIQLDLIYRPYLAWILASPNQTMYSTSFAKPGWVMTKDAPEDYNKSHTFMNTEKSFIAVFRHDGSWERERLPGGRFGPFRWIPGVPHLEWRAFDAAMDWREQEAHLAFLQRYYQWVQDHPRKWPGKHATTISHRLAAPIAAKFRKDKALCENAFKKMITSELELPWDRYSHYLGKDSNLTAAFAWGNRE